MDDLKLLELSDSFSQVVTVAQKKGRGMRKKIKFYSTILIFLMLVLPTREGMSAPQAQTVAETPAVGSYEQLVSAIRQVKVESRERIESLVEAEKVREAWEIGKLIDTHVLQHQQRADYGKQILKRLAKDLGTSQTELSFMLQFARAYPIHSPANKLSWAHYRELLFLNDSHEREELAKQAAQEGWGRDRLREEVRIRQAARKSVEQKESPVTLTAALGTPGTYRVVKANYGKQPNQLVLDLGFSNYLSVRDAVTERISKSSRAVFEAKASNVKISTDGTSAPWQKYKEGDIVTVEKGKLNKLEASEIASGKNTPRNDGRDALKLLKSATEADLFTYKAYVIHVIDGDTFTAAVELGFGFTAVQTLRFRAIDAPEIESTEGREAKEFLERELLSFPRKRESTISGSPINTFGDDKQILIRTHRSDKYDRYLADVFVNGEYMNQKMVGEGFAVPLSE